MARGVGARDGEARTLWERPDRHEDGDDGVDDAAGEFAQSRRQRLSPVDDRDRDDPRDDVHGPVIVCVGVKTEKREWKRVWLIPTETDSRGRESLRPARRTQTRADRASGTAMPMRVGIDPPPRMWEVSARKVAKTAAAAPRRARRPRISGFTPTIVT